MQKHLNMEKITFKVVQIKFLAMHITNKKYVWIYLWNMILISNDFWHNIKMYNFDRYNVLLSIAFVLQGHT